VIVRTGAFLAEKITADFSGWAAESLGNLTRGALLKTVLVWNSMNNRTRSDSSNVTGRG